MMSFDLIQKNEKLENKLLGRLEKSKENIINKQGDLSLKKVSGKPTGRPACFSISKYRASLVIQ